ncbi:fukutin isoform X2 [Oryzias latipes]|uniref:fukutin isoform X2 n=1 Tax=Oryzias latipes TaxID=8090 RepID=UPI000CE1CCE8|nr:fukutin isoform X2 [Oryzias latipes]
MPRVNRTAVLSLLIVSSCVFLLFQLHYYRKYVTKQGGPLLSPVHHLTNRAVQWQVLKKFLALAHHFHLPLFLADTLALSLLSQHALRQRDRVVQEPQCSVLCTDRPVLAFGVHASSWESTPEFVAAAQTKGFELLELRGKDPRLSSLDTLSGEEIPLHFLFRLDGYIIHVGGAMHSLCLVWVVFLYERSGNYLWHGPLRLRADMDRTFAPFSLLDYGRYAGAYDRPELILTVLDRLDVRVPRNITHFLVQQRDARFLECRFHEARHFLQLYPDDSSAAALDFRRKARTLLRVTTQTLGLLHIPFWISSGTCLGWFRQCGVISYSQDVDIGIFISDFRPDIVGAFREAGLSLKHKFGKVEDSLELSFLSQDVKLDIFFFYEDGDVVWNGGTQAKSGRKFKYTFPRFSLCWAELLELKVRVPCETQDYVVANYGSTWSVPLKNWDWKSSPSNVQENGEWPRGQWAELIQVY